LNVSNELEVEEIIANEPATLEQIFVAEAHRWYLLFEPYEAIQKELLQVPRTARIEHDSLKNEYTFRPGKNRRCPQSQRKGVSRRQHQQIDE
jgi:hypothetical protein